MKREFLQNFEVGGEALPKEVIDAIMAENGRDIEAAKTAAVKPYADYDALREENQRLQQTVTDGKTSRQWKEAYEQAVSDHQKELESVRFHHHLEAAIRTAGGRNPKAITALLELDALQGSENPQEAIAAALEQLKQQESYLFTQQTPPPYAWGTGAPDRAEETAPTDLAGALREKYERK